MEMSTVYLKVAIAVGLILVLILMALYRRQELISRKERIMFFTPLVAKVQALSMSCLFIDDLPKNLVPDKMDTKGPAALTGLELKAKALSMSIIYLGFPGILVGLLMEKDTIKDVEIVGWGMMHAPLLRRMRDEFAFELTVDGNMLERGVRIVTVSGVYWAGSQAFVSAFADRTGANLGGTWVARDTSTSAKDIAAMLKKANTLE